MFIKAIPPHRIAVTYKEILKLLSLFFQRKLMKGDSIEEFEQRFAGYIGTEFACAVSSGRYGLKLILESLGLKKGDEIIIPAYTFYVVPEVVKNAGFVPVLVDINTNDYNIDTRRIEEKITEKTKVIIAVHLFGKPCELDKILEIAKKHDLFVIEDCAQSIGAEYRDKKVGSFGNCAYFSFETVKPFHTFGGGMIVTSNKLLHQKLKKATQVCSYPKYSGVAKKIFFTIVESMLTSYFLFTIFIYPLFFLAMIFGKDLKKVAKRTKGKFKLLQTRYTNFQASIGILKFGGLDSQLERMIINAKFLNERLDQSIATQNSDDHTKPIFYYFVVKSKNRNNFSNVLFRKGIIGTTNMAQNCCKNSFLSEHCPVAQEADADLFQIPVYSNFSLKDIERLSNILNRYFKQE